MDTHHEIANPLAGFPKLAEMENAPKSWWAATVCDNSMAPRYSAGDTAYFDRDRPVVPGKDVIVELNADDAEPRFIIRRLIEYSTDGNLMLGTLDGAAAKPIDASLVRSIYPIVAVGFEPDGMRCLWEKTVRTHPDAAPNPKLSPRFVQAARNEANNRTLLEIAKEDGLTEWEFVLTDWVACESKERARQKARAENEHCIA